MTRSAFYTGIILCILFSACNGDQREVRELPRGILPKDSMAYYLSQLHIIDAAMRHREVRKSALQSYAKRGFIEYFDTAGVSHERFVKSLEFWGDDFEDMSEVYDLAMERLSTQLAREKAQQAAQHNEAEAAAEAVNPAD